MAFFDRLLPEPEPPRPLPVWMKPETALPGAVAAEILLALTNDAAVAVSGLRAYVSGFEFTLSGVLRRPDPPGRGFAVAMRHLPEFANGALPTEFLCLGLLFSDGSVATNLGWRPETEPTGPVLISTGGGGGGRRYDMDYWVWPLPPPGPVTFVCQWPSHGIGESRAEIDAQLILDAAARSTRLWPEDARTSDRSASQTA